MAKQNYRCAGCGSKVEMGVYFIVLHVFNNRVTLCLSVVNSQHVCKLCS